MKKMEAASPKRSSLKEKVSCAPKREETKLINRNVGLRLAGKLGRNFDPKLQELTP